MTWPWTRSLVAGSKLLPDDEMKLDEGWATGWGRKRVKMSHGKEVILIRGNEKHNEKDWSWNTWPFWLLLNFGSKAWHVYWVDWKCQVCLESARRRWVGGVWARPRHYPPMTPFASSLEWWCKITHSMNNDLIGWKNQEERGVGRSWDQDLSSNLCRYESQPPKLKTWLFLYV